MDPLIDGFALVSNINNNDVMTTSQIDEDIDSFILANLEANAFEIFDFSQLVASPLNDESSSSTSSLTSTPKTSSPNELFDEFDPTSLKPISFTLPEIETNDGMKIRNEIILNFEPTPTQTAPTTNDVVQTTANFTLNNEVLEAAENDLDIKIDEIDLINELIRSSSSAISPSTSSSEMTTSLNETRIELNDETTRSDDDEDMDDDDNEDEEVSNHRNKTNNKTKRGDVVLTEEEISVYTKEGFKIPTRWPLTKSEEKTLKLVKRKIRNKKSAHVSRERKKKYIDGLEKRVDMCTKENENLLSQVKSLKTQNSDLMTKLNSMQTFLSRILNRNKKTSTAVLFISFFVTFCAYPMIDPLESDPTTLYAIRNGFSRTLLAVPEEPSFFDGFGQFFSDSASNGFSFFSNIFS